MTRDARDWLPSNAYGDAATIALVQNCVAGWAAQWLRGAKWAAEHIPDCPRDIRLPTGATCWQSACRGVALAANEKGCVNLATHMLALPISRRNHLTNADQIPLSDFAGAALKSFCETMALRFDALPNVVCVGASPTINTPVRYTIALADIAALELFVSERLLAAARKALAPHNRKPTIVQPRSDALAGQIIQVGAALGTGKIKLSELGALAPGDVLRIDGPLNRPLALTINGQTKADTTCQPYQADGAIKLRLNATPQPEAR